MGYKPFTRTAPQKYKTVVCRHFENHGTCSLGDKCSFAHGQHELRKMNDVTIHYLIISYSHYQQIINKNPHSLVDKVVQEAISRLPDVLTLIMVC